MPMRSKAQSRAMHAAAQGDSTAGIPASVGKKFVQDSHGQKQSSLPERREGDNEKSGKDDEQKVVRSSARQYNLKKEGKRKR